MRVVRKIYADGQTENASETMTLDQMQTFVGGYIEMVRSSIPHRSLIVNDSGVLDNLPINLNASALVQSNIAMAWGIRGNALLVKS